jgi:hypothetical protein
MGLFKKGGDGGGGAAGGIPDVGGMMEQAQQMQAQAMQAMQGAGSMGAAVAGMQQGSAAVDPALLEPIDGISLERYAQLSKTIGTRQLTSEAQVHEFLAEQGHTPEQWQVAWEGWNARMKADMGLSGHFSVLFNSTPPL